MEVPKTDIMEGYVTAGLLIPMEQEGLLAEPFPFVG